MPLQDSDNFIIGRGTDSYKITYEDLKDDLNYVPPPVGTIDQPTVLEPNDGAGGGDSTYIKSSAITNIEGGGTATCETDPINNVVTITTYSDQATGFFSAIKNAFDGDSSTATRWGDATTDGVLNFNPPLSGELGLSVRQSNRHTFTISHAGGTTAWNNDGYGDSDTGSRSLETVGTFTNITSITSKSLSSYNNEVDRVAIDGVVLTDISGSTLEFDSSTDFNCFEIGDVVQGVDPAVVVTTNNPAGFQSGRGPENILSGDKTSRCDLATSNSGDYQYGIFIDIETLLGPNFTNELDVYTNFNTQSADTDRYKFYVIYTDDTESSKVGFSSGGGWVKVNSVGSKPVKYLVATAIDGRTPGVWTAFGTNNNDASIISSDAVKITDKDPDATPPTIFVDGGTWSNGDTLSKSRPYDTKLTFANNTDLDNMKGEVFGTTDVGSGPFTQTPKLLQTTAIDSVSANSAWNQSQTWSGNVTGLVNEIDAAFNGNNNQNYAYATSANSFTVNFSPAISGSMRILGGTYAALVNATQCVATSSDGKVFPIGANPYDNQDWTPAQTVTNCTSLAFTTVLNTGISLTAIELNGKQLVDTGVAGDPGNGILLTFPGNASTNPDLEYFEAGDELIAAVAQQVNGVTNNVQDHGVSNSAILLDGSSPINSGTTLTPLYNYLGAGGRDGAATISFDPPLKASGGQTIWVNLFSQPNGGGFKVNVNTPDESSLTISNNSTWQIVHTNKTEISNIQFTGRTNSSGIVSGIQFFCTSSDGSGRFTMPDPTPAVNVISVNTATNTMIVDNAGFNAGDVAEYQTKGGKGTIVSVENNTMMVTDSADRDERWIKGFSASDNSSIIDDPLLTNDVQLRGSDFATTPPDADTLKEIIWDINGVEYSAGVTNPWSPLEKLPTNTTVTVKVKYKGNVLEDSIWSPTVTFTTGASMRSLFTRIAALEANDVTDDATDTALITLIAGLAQRIQALEESN